MTLEQAYISFYRPLVHHARRWHRDAKDIAQEAFLRAMAHPEYDLTLNLLCRIARNLANNAHRDRPDDRLVPLDSLPLTHDGHEQQTIAAIYLRQVINALPAPHRAVLLMRSRGFSHEEIAAALGIKPKAAANLLARGFARARKA